MVVAERPVALIQIFDDRGHSVSLCDLAALQGTPGERVVGKGHTPQPGSLCWFDEKPGTLTPSHPVYRSVVEALRQGGLGPDVQLFTQHVGSRDAGQGSASGAISADKPLTNLAAD